MQRQMLSKEDETSSEDVPVRRDDQEKINKFSSLHNRLSTVEETLEAQQKLKESYEETSSDLDVLELEGEETALYKIGDSFFSIPLSEAQELISKSTEAIDAQVSTLESELSTIRVDMQELKVTLYARFGRSINLDY